MLDEGGHGAVLEQDLAVPVAHADAERGEDVLEAGGVGHARRQADGVLHAVAVRIVVGERVEHVIEAVEVGRHLHAHVRQPVLADGEVLEVGARLGDERVDMAVLVGHRHVELVAAVGQDVRAVLLEQRRHVEQAARVAQLKQRVGVEHAVDVRLGAGGDHRVELGAVVRLGDHRDTDLGADAVAELGEHAVDLGGVVVARNEHRQHGLFIRHRRQSKDREHQHEGEQQGQSLFHGCASFSIGMVGLCYPFTAPTVMPLV